MYTAAHCYGTRLLGFQDVLVFLDQKEYHFIKKIVMEKDLKSC